MIIVNKQSIVPIKQMNFDTDTDIDTILVFTSKFLPQNPNRNGMLVCARLPKDEWFSQVGRPNTFVANLMTTKSTLF